jgi:hypothetical protein
MNNLSVVIPSRNAKNLEACVRFGIRAAGERCQIIVVDDGLDQWQDGVMYIDGVKPFIFSRNVNIGIRAAEQDDVVILNDDAILKAPGGFSLLQRAAEEHPEYGVIAATTNNVGNLNQSPQGKGLRADPRMVCFICVLIPRQTIKKVGLLDEEFVGYGFEDDSYCLRVRQAGLQIGVHDGCFVDHKHLPSTFRGAATTAGDLKQNAAIFKEKWGMDNHGRPCA